MKHWFIYAVGVIGGTVATALGGWDSSIINLLVLMAVDLITGIILAGCFKKSKKTETGALSSSAMCKGLIKKCMVLVLVMIANILDVQIGTTYIRDAVCIAFIVNETLSILENAGLMGLPVPKVLLNAIDVLKKKGDYDNE